MNHMASRERTCALVCILVFATILPAPLTAQVAPDPDERVRLTFDADGDVSFCRADDLVLEGDSLHVTGCEASGVYEVASISRMDVRSGRTWSKKGGVIGFLGGAVAGFAIAWPTYSDDYGVPCAKHGNEGTRGCVGVTAATAVLGSVLGAYLMGSDRWEPLPLERVRLVAGPVAGVGFGVGATLRF